ncbi:MAG: hypothetical protein J2P25_22685 [Nocardiopsaceae bacterium]|nr:hypothetical protein [Nocardiopsaceae bacterium]
MARRLSRSAAPVPSEPWGARTRRPEAAALSAVARLTLGYGRWVASSPETRGLGTALAALYPAGEIGYLAHADPALLAGFAAPAAAVAWTSTWKAHRSRKYSAAAAALAAGVPAWLAAAAATGVTSLPELLGYTAASAGAWSAVTWSDVHRHRRAMKARRARWAALAAAAGLQHSRLVRVTDIPTGQEFTVDIRATGSTARKIAAGDLAERLAAAAGLPAERVRVQADARHAGNIIVTIQVTDPWAGATTHPALDPAYAPPRRSVMDEPLAIGRNPDTGGPLTLTVYDDQGGWHTNVTAATGGGKTTLYNNVIEQATARTDMLVMACDLRKGTIPFFWRPALDYAAGLAPDGAPEWGKALRILEWGAAVIRLRSAASGGRNHVPRPDDPALLIIVDEGDTLLGADSPIAHKAKPLAGEILKGGRSAGVFLAYAGQRSVVAYTGNKDLHANSGNKVILRVNRAAEMNNTVPGWEADGMPDMSTYAQGKPGVALVVGPDGRWAAGQVSDLSDLDAVGALARRRGKPGARFPEAIAAALDGYAARHDATTPTGNAPLINLDAARFAPGRPHPVTRMTDDLVSDVAGQLAGMPGAPGKPTPLADLIAARDAVNAAEANDPAVNQSIPVPEIIAAPIVQLLDRRGDAGARRDEIVAAVGKSRSSVANWLAIMRDHGRIVASGSTSAARYYLPEHAPEEEEPEQDSPADDVA